MSPTNVQTTDDPTAWLIVDRLLADANGETHFVKSRLPDEGRRKNVGGIETVFSSIALDASHAFVRCIPDGTDVHHSAPERRLVAVLSGTMEVTASDGEVRQWTSGGLLLATDTGAGKGHRIRAVGGTVVTVVVRLSEALDLDAWTVRA
jgi:hypothetical protein